MKNSLKFISIGLVMVLLLMSQWSVDKSVEAAAVVVAEDTVEWMDTSAEVVEYYSPGSGTSTASFWLKDTALETTSSASTTFTVTSNVAANSTWTVHSGTVSAGAATAASSTGSTYNLSTPASTTISSISVTNIFEDDASTADTGTFTNVSQISATTVAVATYDYHIADS
ncbi:MAG: hypothetical protein VX869_05440, partial [Chloroflexota bacterium]|nr:hypothetical protein [Chloroflexota bacterium]